MTSTVPLTRFAKRPAMPNPIFKRFTVEGAGGFPADMLRVDQCWPATPVDAASLATIDPVPRSVTLETSAKYAPDRRRWLTSGWRVSD